ncbi:E3 ubiquitin-protein ligase SIRP1 [Populus alba x Populus x berolinensis]|nr:E3 ubiquitin-protein ligase SIRP1 [Populus alba x Populus x berolinensis]
MTIRIKYSSCVNFKPQENHQESQRHINGQPLHEEDSMLRVFFSLYKFYFLGNLTGGSMFTTRPVKINSKETCIPITSSLVDDHDQEFKEILTVMGVPGRKQSKILRQMASLARSKGTFSGVSMDVELLVGTYQEITEGDIARAERESMDIEAGQIPAARSIA